MLAECCVQHTNYNFTRTSLDVCADDIDLIPIEEVQA